ncbi:MAG TPA: saccharopine dehydrogenase NADP-binding domain-containing protein, partial [Terriglobales bacterium]|nr:saccharopine dehydrogenase NADP-binding domain-containing protein [Terriglobales bacterium]
PVVHRRWFRAVRIRTQRPDYVEYHLTSNFFGLKQEILARGGPIDNDHYWYEFVSPLATAHVDGSLEGSDGNLNQTETITFRFPIILRPLLWLLKPLLLRQKRDILECDTRLLEREYALELSGFRRYDRTAPGIVVYGGSGFFGRLVVEELLRNTAADILVASRNPKYIDFGGQQVRVKFAESDLSDYGSVLRTIDGASIAMLCGGPFQRMPLSLLRACIDKKISYIDIADDRSFVDRAHKLAAESEKAGIAAFVGCSVVPGLTSLLTQFSRAEVGDIESVDIAISPGTKHPRGPASFECLLTSAGEQFGSDSAHGWSNPRTVEFPEPMGRRTVYRVVDIADYFVQPHYFGTQRVEFGIGSELWILNFMFSWLAALRGKLRVPAKFLIAPSRLAVALAAPFGTSQGGVWIRVEGRLNGAHRQVEWCIWANQKGECIPALPAAIAAAMLLADKIPKKGIVSPDWINREQLIAELSARGVNVAVRGNSREPWQAEGTAA